MVTPTPVDRRWIGTTQGNKMCPTVRQRSTSKSGARHQMSENWSRKTECTCWKSHLAEQRATAPRKFLEGNAGEVSQQNSYQRQWQRFHIVVTCHPTLKKMTPLRGGTETGMVEGWAWNTSPSACSTKWNGRKMMNDKIIQQMRVRLTCDH